MSTAMHTVQTKNEMGHVRRKTRRNVYVSVLMSLLLLSLRSMAQNCDETYFLSTETVEAGQQVAYSAGGTIFLTEGKSFVVDKDGSASLKAGGRIELNAGFEVRAGGGLIALVEGCATDEPDKSPLKVFPNPADNELYVESEYKISGVRLLDLNGLPLIEQKEINSTSFMIDLSKIESGLYLLEVTDEKTVEKVRIQRK